MAKSKATRRAAMATMPPGVRLTKAYNTGRLRANITPVVETGTKNAASSR